MNDNRKGILYTIIGGICWGLCGVLGKYLFDIKGLNAQWLVSVRLLWAGVLLLLIAYIKEKNSIFQVWKNKRSGISMVVFGIFGMSFCQLSYFLAIQYSNAGTATVLQYTAPVVIMIFYALKERRLPNTKEIIVLVMVSVGTFLLATHGSLDTLTITKQALFWGIMAALTLCIYNIQPRKLLADFGSIPTVGWGMLLGGIVLGVIIKPWHVIGTWDIKTVLAISGVIVIGTMISFCSYLEGVRLIGPVKASLFACVEPLVAMILSIFVTKIPFTGVDLAGMLFILVGVGALSVKFPKERALLKYREKTAAK